jgi:hypothetical protein
VDGTLAPIRGQKKNADKWKRDSADSKESLNVEQEPMRRVSFGFFNDATQRVKIDKIRTGSIYAL